IGGALLATLVWLRRSTPAGKTDASRARAASGPRVSPRRDRSGFPWSDRSPLPGGPAEEDRQDRAIGRCPVCATEVLDDGVACCGCETAHHMECFSWNHGCGLYACGGTTMRALGTGRDDSGAPLFHPED
ncbi:MAG: hypothetical protein HY815_28895, partial [Candidatus Riflebacteria bacterium]|nr:hypothetical protein [Candidatus Riflebacteria bacterium]